MENALWNGNTTLETVYSDLNEALQAAQRGAASYLASGNVQMADEAIQRQEYYTHMMEGL